jgi:hypothetical protein
MNGDFAINQRAFTTLSGATITSYAFDRWLISCLAGGTNTYTAQTFTPGAAPVAGYEGKNYLDIQTTGQTATNVVTRIDQRIESVRTFAGQTATFSFWAKAASGTPKIAIELDQQFGTGGSPSSRVTTYAGQVTISTAWARYSVTVAVPSISGKTLGTAGDDYLSLNTWVSAGTDFNARTGSLGIQTNTFSIWGVQAEYGSKATPFQTATGTIQGELAACQRYYYRTTSSAIYNTLTGSNGATSTTQVYGQTKNPVTMRVAPSTIDYSTTYANYQLHDAANNNAAVSAIGIDSAASSIDYAGFFVTGTGLTQFRTYVLQAANSNGAYLGFGAEL